MYNGLEGEDENKMKILLLQFGNNLDVISSHVLTFMPPANL